MTTVLLMLIFIYCSVVVSAGGEYIINSPPALTTSTIISPVTGIKTSDVNKVEVKLSRINFFVVNYSVRFSRLYF